MRWTGIGMALWLAAAGPALGQDVAALVEKVNGGAKKERLAALAELAKLGPAAAKAAPDLGRILYIPDDAEVTVQAAAALAKIGKAGVPELVVALRDSRPFVRQQAMGALMRMGPLARPAEAYVAAGTHDPNAGVRVLAAAALGEMGSVKDDTLAALCRCLQDPAVLVRNQALAALHRAGVRAVPVLIQALRNPQADARANAARTLELIGLDAADAAGSLTESLKDPEPAVRASAALALGALGIRGQDALPDLLQVMVRDQHLRVQQAAFEAVGKVGAGDVQKLADELRKANEQGAWAAPFFLVQFGPRGRDAVRPLIKLMDDRDPGMRLGAVVALGQLGPEAAPAMPFLVKHLQNPDPRMRAAAATTLGQIDPRNAQAGIRQIGTLVQMGNQVARKTEGNDLVDKIGNIPTRTALLNPGLQREFDQILDVHLMFSTTPSVLRKNNVPPDVIQQLNQINRQITQSIQRLPPEAVPALIRAVNKTAYFNLGFC